MLLIISSTGFALATWWWMLLLVAVFFWWQFAAMFHLGHDRSAVPNWVGVAMFLTFVLAFVVTIAFFVSMLMAVIASLS